jgi:hypothetical protein
MSQGLSMPTRFHWLTFDVSDLLPRHWQQEIRAVGAVADFRDFPRTPGLTRETPAVRSISRGRVHADQVRLQLPWLYELYHGRFLDLINGAWGELVMPAADGRYGVVLNVQRGPSMRFECHVDSNPLSAVLFCTDHPKGGELCVAHDPDASGLASIERDCSIIRPHAGHLIVFDGRAHAHYARPLDGQSGLRVAAVMNYYTESFPETTRPRQLNHHLYGDCDLAEGEGRGARDRGAAEDGVAVVKDGGLAGGHGAGRL